jgi:hypothetical protein
MNILITGGTGFIGAQLVPILAGAPDQAQGDHLTLLTRRPEKMAKQYAEWVDTGRLRFVRSLDVLSRDETFDAVINLAGEGIADKPWTSQRRAELHASRVLLTESLGNWLRRAEHTPSVLISGSAVGWYGCQGERILDEESPAESSDYTHHLCRDWEAAALAAAAPNTRVCILRLGVVIGPSGGMLRRLLPVFGLGLGGVLGNGRQYLSWVSRSDVVQVILRMLTDRSLNGVFNVTAPEPVSNTEFTRTLARVLRRPAFLRVPASILKLGLGEMSTLLLDGQRVMPSRLLSADYRFQHGTLEEAIRAALSRDSS